MYMASGMDICRVCSCDDPWLNFDLFMASSDLLENWMYPVYFTLDPLWANKRYRSLVHVFFFQNKILNYFIILFLYF